MVDLFTTRFFGTLSAAFKIKLVCESQMYDSYLAAIAPKMLKIFSLKILDVEQFTSLYRTQPLSPRFFEQISAFESLTTGGY